MHHTRLGVLSLLCFFLCRGALQGVEPEKPAHKPSGPVGWRTDGTGRYPQADPPRKWSTENHVVWRTPLAGFSNAVPVIVGDKLLTCSEPCVLLCLNKADGKILWQRAVSYQDLSLTAEEREKLAAEKKQSAEWGRQQSALEKEIGALRKKVADGILDKKEADEKMQPLRAEINGLKQRRKDLPLASRYTEPGKNSTGGYSAPTPVCDGKHVFVVFGNGLVASFDLEGKRRWLRLVEHSTASYGHAASPVLVGDRLIVHFADLVALDARDGSERWRVKMPPNHGTVAQARIGKTNVLITPTGNLVRAEDGKVLTSKLGSCGPNSPLLHDGKAYFLSSSARAVRLPESLDGVVKAETLWTARLRGGDYWFASPIYHEGLIYAVNGNGNFSIVDATTGKLTHEGRLDCGGRVYPSICLAGNLIFVSSDNGVTLILAPGREYRELARNTLEPFRSTPVFEGQRMYVRTLKHLYCIGR